MTINNNNLRLGRITSGIAQGISVTKIVEFVFDQLPSWRDDLNREKVTAENKLNLQLAKYLESRARELFPAIQFTHQEYQGTQASSDIGAGFSEIATPYGIYDPIVLFEGKRLPPPSQSRVREYVTGSNGKKSGGIQRFKLGINGVSLDTVAIIGYVQKESPSYWHTIINKWIIDLCGNGNVSGCNWDPSEILQKLNEYSHIKVAKCQSVHARNKVRNSSSILIHHLWVVM